MPISETPNHKPIYHSKNSRSPSGSLFFVVKMAAPESVTTLNLSGKYLMNKSLSDSSDEILKLQSIPWLQRKAINLGSLTLKVKHSNSDGAERIVIEQLLTGGIPGTTDERVLVWDPIAREDRIFGPSLLQNRRIAASDIDDEYLKKAWTEDTIKDQPIETIFKSDTAKSGKTWVTRQVWGFEEVNGERKYVRRTQFTGPQGERIYARLVYDYLGPL